MSQAQPGQPSTSSSAPKPGKDKKSKRNISVGQILAGILLVLIVIFVVENSRSVPIRFIAGPEVNTPVYLAILAAAIVGALIGSLLRARRSHKAKSK